MKEHYLHLYYGNGKGKTTAAAGLCLRSLGAGSKVLFCQFLKDGSSSEIAPLQGLGAEILASPPAKFIWHMIPEEKKSYLEAQHRLFCEAVQKVQSGRYEIAVLDEALDALQQGAFTEQELIYAVKNAKCELVLTGRAPTQQLLILSDYATEMTSIKHPYGTEQLSARKGIEF